MGSHQSRGAESPPQPAGHVGQYPQVHVGRAAFNPSIPQSVLVLEVAPSQVQCLELGFAEPHEVSMGPLLELVQIPVDGIPPLRCGNCTTQLGGICRLGEGVLDLTKETE